MWTARSQKRLVKNYLSLEVIKFGMFNWYFRISFQGAITFYGEGSHQSVTDDRQLFLPPPFGYPKNWPPFGYPKNWPPFWIPQTNLVPPFHCKTTPSDIWHGLRLTFSRVCSCNGLCITYKILETICNVKISPACKTVVHYTDQHYTQSPVF